MCTCRAMHCRCLVSVPETLSVPVVEAPSINSRARHRIRLYGDGARSSTPRPSRRTRNPPPPCFLIRHFGLPTFAKPPTQPCPWGSAGPESSARSASLGHVLQSLALRRHVHQEHEEPQVEKQRIRSDGKPQQRELAQQAPRLYVSRARAHCRPIGLWCVRAPGATDALTARGQGAKVRAVCYAQARGAPAA